jgi:hypothetical protein
VEQEKNQTRRQPFFYGKEKNINYSELEHKMQKEKMKFDNEKKAAIRNSEFLKATASMHSTAWVS